MTDATSTPNRDRPKREVKKSQRAQDIHDAGENIPGLSGSDTPKSSISLRSERKMANTQSQSRTTTVQGFVVPKFPPSNLQIYPWPAPRPSDFTYLSKYHTAWKRRTDESVKALDFDDDGADNWHEFDGDPGLYAVREGRFALEYAVARTFINRAKRAFRCGKSWKDFVSTEMSVNSEHGATRETNLKRRDAQLENALNNNLRLAIFSMLKNRLCEEIWLEAYEDSTASRTLPLPAKIQNVGRPPRDVNPLRGNNRSSPTPSEREREIVDWMHDGDWHWQPLYADEMELPNGKKRLAERIKREERKLKNSCVDYHGYEDEIDFCSSDEDGDDNVEREDSVVL